MGLSSRMGDLERAVMEQLWSTRELGHRARPCTRRSAAERDVAYTTVMTVMDRLAKKGLVKQRREGRAYLYQAGRLAAAR